MVNREESEIGYPLSRQERMQFMDEQTAFVQQMPDEYRQDDAVQAYRDYYAWLFTGGPKSYGKAKWDMGVDAPEWWQEKVSE